MTNKQAYLIGKSVGIEILKYGDFTDQERADEDLFTQTFHEISENRKQYAGDITEELKTEDEWDNYESGLSDALDDYLQETK